MAGKLKVSFAKVDVDREVPREEIAAAAHRAFRDVSPAAGRSRTVALHVEGGDGTGGRDQNSKGTSLWEEKASSQEEVYDVYHVQSTPFELSIAGVEDDEQAAKCDENEEDRREGPA